MMLLLLIDINFIYGKRRMKKFKFVKHAKMFDSLSALDSESFSTSMEKLTLQELTTEGFVSSLITRTANVFKSRDKIQEADSPNNSPALKRKNIDKALKGRLFISFINTNIVVEPNFKGKRTPYMRELESIYTATIITLLASIRDTTALAESTYVQKKLESFTSVPVDELTAVLRAFDNLMKRYYSGEGEIITVGDAFESIKDLQAYAVATGNTTTQRKALSEVKEAGEILAERLKALSTIKIDANKKDLSDLSILVLSLAKAQSMLAKVYYMIQTNTVIAPGIINDI